MVAETQTGAINNLRELIPGAVTQKIAKSLEGTGRLTVEMLPDNELIGVVYLLGHNAATLLVEPSGPGSSGGEMYRVVNIIHEQ